MLQYGTLPVAVKDGSTINLPPAGLGQLFLASDDSLKLYVKLADGTVRAATI